MTTYNKETAMEILGDFSDYFEEEEGAVYRGKVETAAPEIFKEMEKLAAGILNNNGIYFEGSAVACLKFYTSNEEREKLPKILARHAVTSYSDKALTLHQCMNGAPFFTEEETAKALEIAKAYASNVSEFETVNL